jgi:hypothetical protein
MHTFGEAQDFERLARVATRHCSSTDSRTADTVANMLLTTTS